MAGLRGSTNAGVRVLPGPLPPARQNFSQFALGPIRQAADDYAQAEEEEAPAPEDKPYDVFLCHASDDKDEIKPDPRIQPW